MPKVEKMRMFTTSGLVQLVIFAIIIFRVLEIEYIDGDEVPPGTASAFLLMFPMLFVVAGAMNT